MELARYKACICEGSAENAIMDILLDHNLLIFSREEMVEEEIIRCREGKKFEEKYLRKGFMDKISVIRILDSRRENFKLSKAYASKVDVINVITFFLILFSPILYFFYFQRPKMLPGLNAVYHFSAADFLTK